MKKPLSKQDIRTLVALFERLQPHQIFAAGDLSDPHGTHRTCLQVRLLIAAHFAVCIPLNTLCRRDKTAACLLDVSRSLITVNILDEPEINTKLYLEYHGNL